MNGDLSQRPIEELERELAALKEQRAAAEPSLASKAWDATTGAVGSAVDSVVGAVRGKHDPQYADLPGFSGQGITDPEVMSKISRAKLITYDDAAYGDIVKKALGPRFVGSQKDANGYEVMAYEGDDGQVHKVYLNKPGLDWQDVDRTLSGMAPFMVGAGAAGATAKGIGAVAGAGGLASRAALQAVGAGGASLAADALAKKAGSEQGTDWTRAGIAAGTGAAAELAAPAVQALWDKFVRIPRLVKNGRLTPKGVAEAKKLGIDPDILNNAGKSKDFAKDMVKSFDPVEVGTKYRTQEFGLPTTKGMRIKAEQPLLVEKEMRAGRMGQPAQSVMEGYDQSLASAVDDAAYTRVGKHLSPGARGKEPATLGTRIQGGMKAAQSNMKDKERALWEAVPEVYPTQQSFPLLQQRVSQSLAAKNIMADPQTTPQAIRMLEMLEKYTGATPPGAVNPTIPFLGNTPTPSSINAMRKYLLNLYEGAATKTDASVAQAIYRGYNQWIDDIANHSALLGDPSAASAMRVARGFTREMHELFEPGGAKTPASKLIGKIMKDATSPEEAVSAIVGHPAMSPKSGQVAALKQMRDILLRNNQREAWDDIRLAYWVKMVQDGKGNTLPALGVRNSIDSAFRNQSSTLNVLYTPQEKALMRRLSTALEDVTPSVAKGAGKTAELQRLENKFGRTSALKEIVAVQRQRETFSKHNPIMARIYMLIGRQLPLGIAGSKENFAAKLAERYASDALTKAGPLTTGGFGAGLGAQWDSE